jgi:hypothetical protein
VTARGSGRRRNCLSYQEEKIFLVQFFALSVSGENVLVAEIRQTLGAKIKKV